jgi:hypothetical protein
VNRTVAPTFTASIYIAGDPDHARRICAAHCYEIGLCVTVEALDFVYTGGQERGVRVGLINYPRFPTTPKALKTTAEALALVLIDLLYQTSCSIVFPDETVWLSRREE